MNPILFIKICLLFLPVYVWIIMVIVVTYGGQV